MLPEVTWPEMTWPEVTWPEVTSQEVTSFSPAFFSYHSSSTKCPIVVCHSIYSFWLFLLVSFGQCVVLSFDLRLLIIPLVSSSLSCKGTFCTTTIVRKKRRKITSLPVMTSLPVAHFFPNYDDLQVLKTVKYWSNP